MLERENDLRSCSLADAFTAIGGKWKPYIVWYLNTKPDFTMRYGELKRHIPWKISHKIRAASRWLPTPRCFLPMRAATLLGWDGPY